MSSNINIPPQKPLIQEAQNMLNNGGGGNLGYFQQEKKKKKNSNSTESIFEEVFDEYISSDSQKETQNAPINYYDKYIHEDVEELPKDYIYKAKNILKKFNLFQN